MPRASTFRGFEGTATLMEALKEDGGKVKVGGIVGANPWFTIAMETRPGAGTPRPQ